MLVTKKLISLFIPLGYELKVFYRGKNLKVLQGEKKINIQLWDIPGHERFGGMTNVYYKYSHGALVVFDLSR